MMEDRLEVSESDALIVIDPQLDFCPGGALAVLGGNEIMPGIARLTGKFRLVVFTQDWHPPEHRSFASSHAGAEAFGTAELPYGSQVLWPDHCVQGSVGADFHPALVGAVDGAHLILRKGYNPEIDSYSAFYENRAPRRRLSSCHRRSA
jgi:nicotinamidase/pyrazinamidase